MGAFSYSALNASGQEQTGVLEGDNERHVRSLLRERGMVPVDVAALQSAAADTPSGRGRRSMSAAERALVTRQLATLTRAGLPLERALHDIARQLRKPSVERILSAVRARVREGFGLAQALREFPAAFPELYWRTVAAGEQSGRLDAVLDRLADYTESQQSLRQKTLSALFYPAMLTLFAVLIVSGLVIYVIPQVVGVFDQTGAELPLLTRGVLALSDFLQRYGMALLVLMGAGIWLARRLLRDETRHRRWHRFMLRWPVVGRLIRANESARFARTLSILTASSVPIVDALNVAAEVMTNRPMRQAAQAAAERVREGSSLAAALEPSAQFPPMMISLVASGESGGNLSVMLERAAQLQENEADTVRTTALSLFEPLMILLMGIVVLLIVIAILLPVFELNRLIGI